MRDKLKKIMVSILTFVMIVTMLPVTANAASTKKESESNNSRTKANKITTQYARTGSLSGIKDEDWYVYTVDNTGLTDITFKITGNIKAEHAFYVDVYNGKTRLEYACPFKEQKTAKFKNISVKKGTKLYIHVMGLYQEGDNPNYKPGDSEIPKGVKYTVSVKNTKKTNWETENNDTMAKADTLKTKISGVVNCCCAYPKEDVDYYVFTAASTTSDITLTVNKKDTTHTMHIYNAKGKELAYSDYVFYNTITLSVKTEVGEKYYVEVKRRDQAYDSAATYPYTLEYVQGQDTDIVVGNGKNVTFTGTVRKVKYTTNAGVRVTGYVLELDESIVIYDEDEKYTTTISELQITGDVASEYVGQHIVATGKVRYCVVANYACDYLMDDASVAVK